MEPTESTFQLRISHWPSVECQVPGTRVHWKPPSSCEESGGVAVPRILPVADPLVCVTCIARGRVTSWQGQWPRCLCTGADASSTVQTSNGEKSHDEDSFQVTQPLLLLGACCSFMLPDLKLERPAYFSVKKSSLSTFHWRLGAMGIWRQYQDMTERGCGPSVPQLALEFRSQPRTSFCWRN